jgi:hypothetical protein
LYYYASRAGAARKYFSRKILEPPPEQTKLNKKLTMAALFLVFSYNRPHLLPSFFDATVSTPPTNNLPRSEI